MTCMQRLSQLKALFFIFHVGFVVLCVFWCKGRVTARCVDALQCNFVLMLLLLLLLTTLQHEIW